MEIGAIIMAGGEGVRLRPMTLHCPKPLVPLLGRPVMGYTLQLLKKHGINEAGVTLWYQPKMIRSAFRSNEQQGVKLHFFEETAPMGTAGSVGMAREYIRDTFFVLSGDGLTDCDLTEAMKFHKSKKAMATIVLKKVAVPLQYGAVMTDGSGRITRFVEKPDWSRAFTNLVNTGIYILEPEIFSHIPTEGMTDFGKDVFPALLEKGIAMYGWEMQGYWCDVGSQEAYLQAQQDLLTGKVMLDAKKGVHPKAKLSTDVHMQGHFYIDEGAVVEKGAVIRDAVIGPGCRIGAGAVIENSSLWQQVQVGAKARIEGSVLCRDARVMGGAVLENGCTVGQEGIVGAHVKMHPGVKIWPKIRVTSGAVLRDSRQVQENDRCCWEDDVALCDTAEMACRLAQVYAGAAGCRKLVTAHLHAEELQAVISGALAFGGAEVMAGDFATLPMLQETVRVMGTEGGILVTEKGMIFLEKTGLPVSDALRRNMDQRMLSGASAEHHAPGKMKRLDGMEEIYLSSVAKMCSRQKLQTPIAVFCMDEQVLKTAEKMLKALGVTNFRTGKGGICALRKGETGFLLSEDGQKTTCFTEQATVEDVQLKMLLLMRMHEKHGEIYDLPEVPRALAALFPLQEADDTEQCIRQQIWMEDGLFATAVLCDAMKEADLASLLAALPGTHMMYREVACTEGDKGRILYDLCRQAALPYTLNRGMQVRHDTGYATIVPHQTRPSVRIVGEADTMEAADELCDFYDREIRRALEIQRKAD